VRNIRNSQQELLQSLVKLSDALVPALDFLRHGFHLRQQRVALSHRRRKGLFTTGRLLLNLCFDLLLGLIAAMNDLAKPRNLLASLVALSLQPLNRGDNLPPLSVQLAKRRKVERDAAVPRHLLNHIQVLSHISQVQHRPSRIPEGSG
jgi:hypothetical protein